MGPLHTYVPTKSNPNPNPIRIDGAIAHVLYVPTKSAVGFNNHFRYNQIIGRLLNVLAIISIVALTCQKSKTGSSLWACVLDGRRSVGDERWKIIYCRIKVTELIV